jgi:hypothetical protein
MGQKREKFFTKNRVGDTLLSPNPVFDQTFVKSLRVRNALRVGLAIYFFVNENGA